MTSPASTSLHAPEPTLPSPRRRAFGVQAKSNELRPSSVSSSASSSRVPTPSLNASPPFLAADDVNHKRSSSFTAEGVNKAQAWLSTWAPRGEGRGRAFVSNTLTGVAGVASQVGHELNGAFGNFGVQLGSDARPGNAGRPSSFSAYGTSPSPTIPSEHGSSPELPVPPPSAPPPVPVSKSPPIPTGHQHTSSTPAIPTTKKVLQPANISRLGPSSPSQSSERVLQRPAISHPNTSTNLSQSQSTPQSIHGHSHLNPNSNGNSRSASFSHVRSPSIGGASPAAGVSRSNSQLTGGLSVQGKGAGMPYKVGFQPAGVRSDRTEEFTFERVALGEERAKVEGRLGRRWAKLVDLHFNPNAPSQNGSPVLPRSNSSSLSLASVASNGDKRRSLMSLDGAFDAIRGQRDVWRGVKSNLDPRGGPAADDIRKRAVEQTIVKWQDDAEAKKCFVCQSSFSLKNRKHHCRLCGRVVCALPPTPAALLAVHNELLGSTDPAAAGPSSGLPQGMRRERCSLLLVADWKTGRGEEVEEGFVGWMKTKDPEKDRGSSSTRRGSLSSVRTMSSASGSASGHSALIGEDGLPLPQQPREIQVKGVRVCRECWGIVSRKQKIADRKRITGFERLYRALRSLQAEIEEVMPDFEELMTSLITSNDLEEPGPQVIKLHKRLLDLFAQFELLSKRMSGLPVEEGSSQSIVQSAIARSSAAFLAMEMIRIQALPRYQKHLAEQKRQHLNIAIVETSLAEQLRLDGNGDDQANDAALALQPLLEQEAQLETMIAQAHAQRKYEDGKALSEALADIRSEISVLTESAIR